ncbi:hypothetical protein ACLOJK_008140 [Asimina triloba]
MEDGAENIELERQSCGQGHRSTVQIETVQGGSICLMCFSNLVSGAASAPPIHLSYALSQISQAIRSPAFVLSLQTFHAHLLFSPLSHAVVSLRDEPLARQASDLIADLCTASPAFLPDFVARISDLISSGALAWSPGQIHAVSSNPSILSPPLSHHH